MGQVRKKQRLLLPKEDVPSFLPQEQALASASNMSATVNPLEAEERQKAPVALPAGPTSRDLQTAWRWSRKFPKSDNDWNQVKELMEEYHMRPDKPLILKEVVTLIENKLGLYTTVQQLQNKKKEWGFTTNFSERHYRHIMRIEKNREFFNLARKVHYFVRGRKVEQRKIKRYLTKHPNAKVASSGTLSYITVHSEKDGAPPRPKLLGAKRSISEDSDEISDPYKEFPNTIRRPHITYEADVDEGSQTFQLGGALSGGSSVDNVFQTADDEIIADEALANDMVTWDPQNPSLPFEANEQAKSLGEMDIGENDIEDEEFPLGHSIISSEDTATHAHISSEVASEPVRVASIESGRTSHPNILLASSEPLEGLTSGQPNPQLPLEWWLARGRFGAISSRIPDPKARTPHLAYFPWSDNFRTCWHRSKLEEVEEHFFENFLGRRRSRFQSLIIRRNTYDADMLHEQKLQTYQVLLAELKTPPSSYISRLLKPVTSSHIVAVRIFADADENLDFKMTSNVDLSWCLSEVISYLCQEIVLGALRNSYEKLSIIQICLGPWLAYSESIKRTFYDALIDHTTRCIILGFLSVIGPVEFSCFSDKECLRNFYDFMCMNPSNLKLKTLWKFFGFLAMASSLRKHSHPHDLNENCQNRILPDQSHKSESFRRLARELFCKFRGPPIDMFQRLLELWLDKSHMHELLQAMDFLVVMIRRTSVMFIEKTRKAGNDKKGFRSHGKIDVKNSFSNEEGVKSGEDWYLESSLNTETGSTLNLKWLLKNILPLMTGDKLYLSVLFE